MIYCNLSSAPPCHFQRLPNFILNQVTSKVQFTGT
jgi:hypothetical protein